MVILRGRVTCHGYEEPNLRMRCRCGRSRSSDPDEILRVARLSRGLLIHVSYATDETCCVCEMRLGPVCYVNAVSHVPPDDVFTYSMCRVLIVVVLWCLLFSLIAPRDTEKIQVQPGRNLLRRSAPLRPQPTRAGCARVCGAGWLGESARARPRAIGFVFCAALPAVDRISPNTADDYDSYALDSRCPSSERRQLQIPSTQYIAGS